MKNKITGQFKLIYQYSEWGLGCNTIHFLDLFGFFLKTNKIKVSHSNLDNKIYKSKREGYLEFKGSLELTFNNTNTVGGSTNGKIRIYGVNYNILKIENGQGGLLYMN